MFENLTLSQFDEILASKAPTPGGGSALAVVGTVACSLVEMAVNVTLAKQRFDEFDEQKLTESISFFKRSRARLFQLAEDDSKAFRAILDCKHLPQDTPQQKSLRESELQKAYHRAALVPLDVMRLCAQALKTAQKKIFPLLYKYVASDCKIGIDLFKNIIENSMETVRANTCLIADNELAAMLEKQGTEIAAEAAK